MNIKKKKWILLICVVIFCLLLLINIGVGCNPFDSGGCISVTFDKLPMMLADRAVTDGYFVVHDADRRGLAQKVHGCSAG